MTTALTAPLGHSFSQEQINIIKSQVAPEGTTNDELAMFLMYCERTGLDPFARQIYLSERRSQKDGQWITTRKPETTIDGFRLIAERGGKYAGQLGPFWCGEDGIWHDVWIPQSPPIAARIGVLRHDFTEPLWAVALYDEYLQKTRDGKPNSMWSKMPANQLAKCAESLALRRAFPRELSGLYTREEMPSEQQEGKDAQRDYLASKGLEPYVVPKDLPPAPKPELICELAATLDEPPTTKTIEMRSAAQVAEADAALSEVKAPPKRKKGGVSFDVLKHFGEVKKILLEATGSTESYYSILRAHGFKHSDEITDNDKAREIYKAMLLTHKTIMEDKKLRTELELAEQSYGHDAFMRVLGANGCTSIDDCLLLSSDPLRALRNDIKALGHGL